MIKITKLDEKILSTLNFKELWKLHPPKKNSVIVENKNVDAHRYYKSYLYYPKYNNNIMQTYMFSDNLFKKHDFPDILIPLLSFINQNEKIKYNQMTINWFENGCDYIPYHSDCLKDIDGNILILSLGAKRKLSFKNKNSFQKIEIDCVNGTLVEMDINNQKEFRHSIKKDVENTEKRISISFRKYKE